MKHIKYDKEFFDSLYAAYPRELKKIALGFISNDSDKYYTAQYKQLTIPNEVCDFLDGNGFKVRYVNDEVCISLINEPEFAVEFLSSRATKTMPASFYKGFSEPPKVDLGLSLEDIEKLLGGTPPWVS